MSKTLYMMTAVFRPGMVALGNIDLLDGDALVCQRWAIAGNPRKVTRVEKVGRINRAIVVDQEIALTAIDVGLELAEPYETRELALGAVGMQCERLTVENVYTLRVRVGDLDSLIEPRLKDFVGLPEGRLKFHKPYALPAGSSIGLELLARYAGPGFNPPLPRWTLTLSLVGTRDGADARHCAGIPCRVPDGDCVCHCPGCVEANVDESVE